MSQVLIEAQEPRARVLQREATTMRSPPSRTKEQLPLATTGAAKETHCNLEKHYQYGKLKLYIEKEKKTKNA